MDSKFLEKLVIEIPCPECKEKTKILVGDIARGKTIACSGCKKNIKLEDKDESIKKANRALGELEDTLKNLNKTIKINIKL